MNRAYFMLILPFSLAITANISAKTAPKDPLPKSKTAAKPAQKAPKKAATDIDLSKVKNLSTESEHRVLAGETFGGIAYRAQVPRIIIAEAHGRPPPWDVRIGAVLQLPRTKQQIAKSGETGVGMG